MIKNRGGKAGMGRSTASMAFALGTDTLIQDSAAKEVHLWLELMIFCETFSPFKYVINIWSRSDTASQ